MNAKSLRRERFETVAARRAQKIIDALEVLGNCSNKSNYEYSDEDVRKMFAAIEGKTKNVKSLFGNALSKGDKEKFKF